MFHSLSIDGTALFHPIEYFLSPICAFSSWICSFYAHRACWELRSLASNPCMLIVTATSCAGTLIVTAGVIKLGSYVLRCCAGVLWLVIGLVV